ncbi:MAG TPA: hypothetical protein VK762_31675 [Polyangiaceae bacterium]|nr:hypothetical protein [Polyangiaceae bacterium]
MSLLSSSADDAGLTMTTLYANGPGVAHARSGREGPYPAGSMLARVMWTQRDDPHWFGGRIPGPVLSVETVTVAAGPDGKASYAHQEYRPAAASPAAPLEGPALQVRIDAFLAEKASPLP